MNFLNISLNNLHERELHPFLVRYLAKKMNVYSKTIYHEDSVKSGKGKSAWLHPDIVGFNLPVENWSEKVLELCGNFSINRATIYSFELKKIVTIESLREQFFQAVSNSSWANEGYLVGVDIDTENLELMQEMNRLTNAFGIGIIKLNLANCENSEILFQARRKNILDGETMNKLFNINNDFKEFIQVVLDSIKINTSIVSRLDTVVSLAQLKEILEKADVKTQEVVGVTGESNIKLSEKQLSLSENCFDISFKDDFTGLIPELININGHIIHASTWKELYISTCNYLIERDLEMFLRISKEVRGRKRPYFAEDLRELRVPQYFEDINIYSEINLSSNTIGVIMKQILDKCGIDSSSVKIRVKNPK